MAGLRQFVIDETLEVLRLLVDRRHSHRRIGEDHTRMVCQLHVLLLEPIPGGAIKDLSAAQARQLLATVPARTPSARPVSAVASESGSSSRPGWLSTPTSSRPL